MSPVCKHRYELNLKARVASSPCSSIHASAWERAFSTQQHTDSEVLKCIVSGCHGEQLGCVSGIINVLV